jgi:hypothetical protein
MTGTAYGRVAAGLAGCDPAATTIRLGDEGAGPIALERGSNRSARAFVRHGGFAS